jgi:hypothetical protein
VSPVLFATVMGALLTVYGSVVLVGAPLLERARPTASLAEGLRAKLADNDEVALYGLDKWRFSLRYYLARPVSRLENSEDVEKFLSGNRGYVLMLDEDFAKLRNNGVRLRSVDKRRAITGTSGRGLRRQKWGALVVATSDDTPRTTEKPK